jgi:hypothetical protein
VWVLVARAYSALSFLAWGFSADEEEASGRESGTVLAWVNAWGEWSDVRQISADHPFFSTNQFEQAHYGHVQFDADVGNIWP